MSSIPNAVELQRNPGNILITNKIYVYYQFKRSLNYKCSTKSLLQKMQFSNTLNLNLHEA